MEERAAYDQQARRQALPTVALALELGLFERIAGGECTATTLAPALGVSLRACEVLVSVCAALGLLCIAPDGVLACTEMGSTHMLRASPKYRGPPVPAGDHALTALRRAVCEPGQATHEIAVNMEALSEENARWFSQQMGKLSGPAAAALAREPVFAGIGELLDVGGGAGALCCALASAHPHMHCTVLDLPPVCKVGAEAIAAQGLSDRVACCPGDMFKSAWPGQRDAVLFSNVFHDWELDTCAGLARRAFDALRPGGSILLHEMLLDDDRSGPLAVACCSVTLLLFERGRQYTASEFRQLLAQAGFVDFRATPTYAYYSLVQARKP
ncbi:methyltransferase [Ramlibacter sp.]|uniref:methyltransferase n=1 Tax=Ramlibacter sp. TaxID=1917967 RepID=UPI0017EB46D6|nr:methyltransferase [Ramlibacter sp.]MBA2675524.1 methyltransferase domain-containing protein [Ramlibacter sp.]